jgi:hypothetical protein
MSYVKIKSFRSFGNVIVFYPISGWLKLLVHIPPDLLDILMLTVNNFTCVSSIDDFPGLPYSIFAEELN